MFGRFDHAKLEEMKHSYLLLFLLATLLASCTPTPAPIYFPTLMPTAASAPSSVPATLPVAATVETFYKLINNAQSPNDFNAPWDMLTNEEQCNTPEKCDLSYFQEKWMESKVIYKIYECSPDHAIVEERLYPRTADPALASPNSRLIRFQLAQADEKIFISNRKTVFALEEGCILAVDSTLSP